MSRQRIWVAPGLSANVAGQTIPGGLFYVGQYLRSGVGTIEPALINPVLAIDRRPAPQAGRSLPASPSYHLISATDRAGYLGWLAGGRAEPAAPIGFVVLFLSGLERRVLLDLPDDPQVRLELPAITAEVRRLREVYGSAGRFFDTAARAFLEVLELLTAPGRWGESAGEPAAPAVPSQDRLPVPLALRVALAQFARSGRSVPADWARSWAWYHPTLFPSTPQTRCPDEFNTLFALRYRARLPAGLVPKAADRPALRLGYRPVNPGLDPTVVQRPDLPDVLEEGSSTRELGALVDSVTEALTPYSRWLARNPDGEGSTASTILLPTDLLEHHPGPLRRLVNWANNRLAGQVSTVIDGHEFAPFWASADPAAMSRDESTALAVVLARLGLGVEPDLRFGGVALGPGPVVLFRLDPESAGPPSPGYLRAVIMLDIAATAILSTSTARFEDLVNLTITALAAEVPLSIGERSRLSARLRWLVSTSSARTGTGSGPNREAELNRLRRKAGSFDQDDREAAGHFLVSVALSIGGPSSKGAGGLVSSEVVRSLTTAYRIVALPDELLFERLHQHGLADDPARDAPVLVRRAGPRAGTAGPALPRRSPTAQGSTPTNPQPALPRADDGPIRLRLSAVNRTLAQTEAVSALLGDIFTESDPVAVIEPAAPAVSGQIAGLDQVHGSLLRQLATQLSWTRANLAELAARHGVLPDGALDVINEAALELTGEPVIEGDDELMINRDVLRAILA